MKIGVLTLTLTLLSVATAMAQTNSSAYTSLEEKQCKTQKSPNEVMVEYEGRCRGVAGYALIVNDSDQRMNVTVVTPKSTKHSLDLWEVISGGFSTLGAKAEWRMAQQDKKLVPVALIIRYNANKDAENPNKVSSYLAVTKITATEICVTHKINSGPKANEEARVAADAAANKPCLKKKQEQ